MGSFHHSSELTHASLGFVDVLLILFIEISCIYCGERYANSVGSLQFRDWESLSLHVAKSGAAGQRSQSDKISDSKKAFCST